MTNMSKVLSCDSSADCKAWQAPHFEHRRNSYAGGEQPPNAAGQLPAQSEELYRKQIYEQSYADGYAQGLEKGQAEIRQQVAYLQSLMMTLATPLHELDKQVVDDLVQLAMAVVRQMVRRELKLSPGEVVAVVKEALGQLPVSAGDVRLELHPEDAALVRNALSGVDAETQAPWRIVEDPVLSRGGCRVSTENSRIDATVESRINSAIAAAMGGERQVD
jgi:flagellar assembly protein FliH